MYQTILVPVDGSKRAEAILDHAENLAKSDGAQVVFIRVEDEPLMVGLDEVIDVAHYHREFESRAERIQAYLDDLKTRFREKEIDAVTRLGYGPVTNAILNTAAEVNADIIAMATHGFGGLARVSYGSVAAGVLQAAEIPILLIRSGDDLEM